jgi:hypothetical protein
MKDGLGTITLYQEDDSFVLRHRDPDGNETTLRLSDQDILALGNSARTFAKAILLRRTPKEGNVTPQLLTPVAQFSIGPDSLGEDILLRLVSPKGNQSLYAIPHRIARLLHDRLGDALVKIESSKPTRQ